MTDPSSDIARLEFDREKWREEAAFRKRDLDAKDLEQARFFTPVSIAIIVASIGALSNAAVAYMNGLQTRDAERMKSEAQLILASISTDGDTNKSVNNLNFLLKAGLITGDYKISLANYLQHVKPEDRPTLGSDPCRVEVSKDAVPAIKLLGVDSVLSFCNQSRERQQRGPSPN